MNAKQRRDYYQGSFAKIGDMDYWKVFVNLLDKEEVKEWQAINALAPDEKLNVLHAYVLWDKLFYLCQSEYPYDECRFYGKGFEEKKQRMVRTIRSLWNEHKLLMQKIELVASHWVDFRNQFFEDEKKVFDTCEKIDDYETFLNQYPGTYGEFLLLAQLRISELTHQPFRQFGELKRRFPNSDYVAKDVTRIKTIDLNGREIQCMYSKQVENNKKLQDAMRKLMKSFVGPFDETGETSNSQHVLYVLREPLTLSLWRTIVQECCLKDVDLLFPTFCKNNLAKVIAKFETFEKMAVKLSELLSIDFFIPTCMQLNHISGCNKDNVWKWEWVRYTEKDHEIAGVIDKSSIGKTEKNHDNWLIHEISKDCYADCRLAFFQ